MKTIKEVAEELSTTFRKEQGDVGYSEQLSYKLGIEAGVNYVLEKFVDIVNKNTKSNGMEDRAEMASDMLILIEQLKK
jgi:non-canonical (house-cleaning) NTP pyrophosphatase